MRMVQKLRVLAADILILCHAQAHIILKLLHLVEHAAGNKNAAGIRLAVEGAADFGAVALLPACCICLMAVKNGNHPGRHDRAAVTFQGA